MTTLAIGEIQKNIALFKNLEEPAAIVNKRTHETLAIVYPARQQVSIGALAGKYQNRIAAKKRNIPFEQARKEVWERVIGDKYGSPA